MTPTTSASWRPAPLEITPATGGLTDFAAQAHEVALRVRTALGESLKSCGADASKPQAMGRHLKLDKSLAWKIARVVTDDDPLAAVSRLPGRAGARLMVSALERAGSPAPHVAAVRQSLEAFETLIDRHAGDRETFEMMLASLTPGGRERDEQFRRMAFQGNSSTFGVRASVQLSAHFVAPSKDKGKLDLAVISGLLDFIRLRSSTPWAVASIRQTTDEGSTVKHTLPGAIDAEGVSPEGMPVLREFSSDPLPPLAVNRNRPGVVRFELAAGPVGNTAAIDCVTGWIDHAAVPTHRTATDRFGEHFVTVSTPSELLVHDLFVHKSLAFAHAPTAAIYSQLPTGPTYPLDGRDQGVLPIQGEVSSFAWGTRDLETPEVREYSSMVELAMSRMGVPPGEFIVQRFRLRYPPIPTLVVWRYDLPAK